MVDVMSKNYNWRIRRNYYNLINEGIKTLEVRVGYPNIRRVKKGDTITFYNCSNIKFEVIRVACYQNFHEMLNHEDSSKAIPDVTKHEALSTYQKIYSETKEALGVYVFELRKQISNTVFYTLSLMANNYNLFGKFVYAAYSTAVDYICKDYPNHLEWYYTKQIPRVFNGTGEIIICTVGGNIAGLAFLKKDKIERKICTLLVIADYRKQHIATKLLELAFKYLGTTTPLITITDYKISMFEHIIKKYNWKLTQIMNRGYYNNTSREYVYNGSPYG